MIAVENLHKSFNGIPVLENIDAHFQVGQTNLIIGKSGSGKTVFLKSLVGLFTPDKGNIFFDGQNQREMNEIQKRQLQRDIGMVFQGNALFDSVTIAENIMLPLKMFTKQPLSEMSERVDAVLKRVNLPEVHYKFPSQLSGGMQKRVALARAIVMNPKYLFCDEPNSGLDPQTAIVIDNLIQEITKEYQMTTIINTHDMNSVMEIGEKIIFLHRGTKAWEGCYKDILNANNKSVTDFICSSKLLRNFLKSAH